MRGHDEHQESMFSYVSPEKRVPTDHPLRRVRELTDHASPANTRRQRTDSPNMNSI